MKFNECTVVPLVAVSVAVVEPVGVPPFPPPPPPPDPPHAAIVVTIANAISASAVLNLCCFARNPISIIPKPSKHASAIVPLSGHDPGLAGRPCGIIRLAAVVETVTAAEM